MPSSRALASSRWLLPLLTLVVLLAVADRSSGHRFTRESRCFQGGRSMLSLEETEQFLPHRGRIRSIRSLHDIPAGSPPAPSATFNASSSTRIADGGTITLAVTFSDYVPTPDDYVTISW